MKIFILAAIISMAVAMNAPVEEESEGKIIHPKLKSGVYYLSTFTIFTYF